MEQGTRVEAAIDIQLVLYVLDAAVIATALAGERFGIADGVWLRLLGTERSVGRSGPFVLALAVEFAVDLPGPAIAEALWNFLRPRRGGRGVVTARIVRRREERRTEEPDGTPVVERHELWFAIPLRSNRGARRQIDAFFEEVLQPA